MRCKKQKYTSKLKTSLLCLDRYELDYISIESDFRSNQHHFSGDFDIAFKTKGTVMALDRMISSNSSS